MSNRSKMHYTNNRLKRFLIENGWKHFNLFPHSRFSKDYHLEDCDFDAFAFKDRTIWFFQFKTNKKCTKKMLLKYKRLENKYRIKCAWMNRTRGNIEFSRN